MPLFWLGSGADGASALDFLKGTEAWRLVNETDESGATLVEDIDAFFEAVARGVYSKVLGSSSVETLTRQDFALAYGLVSSRAFLIDAYHGLAMVPIADAFNHVQENHVHLQSDYEVCPECGSLRQCIHDGGEDLPSETWEDDCLEMISNRPIESGVEVFNTYGEMLSNAQLLLQYGFILDGNENDRVTWTCDEMAEFVHSSLHWDPAPVRQTTDWLQSLSWEILEESSELVYIDRKHAFCVNADGTVSHGLWLYLAAALVCSRTGIRGPTSAQEAILSGVEHLLRCQSGMEQHESPEHISGYTTNGSTIHQLSGLIFSLCRARSAGISRGEPTIRELGELLDSLPEDSAPSRRMAVSLALTEKSILETCMFTWQSLAETFVHVSDSDG
ncbi:unnamed protein product [Mycena citricolor]|uniref:SET domain-containing protein n=1 Tax=Mycena citricolor TaxID=2018698 RepID=A0AAD2HGD7_9AGAR|nr:unnamed protein product [Mycena citricolor]